MSRFQAVKYFICNLVLVIMPMCMQAPDTQLSTDMVKFKFLAARGHKNAATTQSHKRKRKGL